MNDQFNSIKTTFLNAIESLIPKLVSGAQIFFSALLLFLVGWLIARSLSYVVNKLLVKVNFDAFANRVGVVKMLEKAESKLTASQLISKTVYWIIMMLFVVSVTDYIGLKVISEQLTQLINLLPKLFSGLILFFVGMAIVGFIRNILWAATGSLGISQGRLMGSLVYYFLMVMVTITALNQVGIDTSLITQNLSLIIGAVLVAGAISYGLASREALTNILALYFGRKTFKTGQLIEINHLRGRIVSIDGVYITLDTDTGQVVLPTRELMVNCIHIIEEAATE